MEYKLQAELKGRLDAFNEMRSGSILGVKPLGRHCAHQCSCPAAPMQATGRLLHHGQLLGRQRHQVGLQARGRGEAAAQRLRDGNVGKHVLATTQPVPPTLSDATAASHDMPCTPHRTWNWRPTVKKTQAPQSTISRTACTRVAGAKVGRRCVVWRPHTAHVNTAARQCQDALTMRALPTGPRASGWDCSRTAREHARQATSPRMPGEAPVHARMPPPQHHTQAVPCLQPPRLTAMSICRGARSQGATSLRSGGVGGVGVPAAVSGASLVLLLVGCCCSARTTNRLLCTLSGCRPAACLLRPAAWPTAGRHCRAELHSIAGDMMACSEYSKADEMRNAWRRGAHGRLHCVLPPRLPPAGLIATLQGRDRPAGCNTPPCRPCKCTVGCLQTRVSP